MTRDPDDRSRPAYPVDYDKVALSRGDPLTDFWLSGYVRGFPDLHFRAKVYDRAGRFGLYGSRVSKLDIRYRGQSVVQYDRGWIQRPPSPDHYTVINKLVSAFPEPTAQQYRALKRAQRDQDQMVQRRRANMSSLLHEAHPDQAHADARITSAARVWRTLIDKAGCADDWEQRHRGIARRFAADFDISESDAVFLIEREFAWRYGQEPYYCLHDHLDTLARFRLDSARRDLVRLAQRFGRDTGHER